MMKEIVKAATVRAATLAAVIGFGAMIASEASAGEFCRQDVTGHMKSCGFDSMAQCQAASAGIGGDCFRDPNIKDNTGAFAYQPKSSHARRGSSSTVGAAVNTSR
jgi:hypothetical protein